MTKRRMVIGISGATGIVYGIPLLEILREPPLHAGPLKSMLAAVVG